MKGFKRLAFAAVVLTACNTTSTPEADDLPSDVQSISAQAITGKDGLKDSKLSSNLAFLVGVPNAGIAPQAVRGAQNPNSVFPTGSTVLIDAVSDQPEALLSRLNDLGFQGGSIFEGTVSGRLPVSALKQVADIPELRFVRPSLAERNQAAPEISTGLVTSQGVNAMNADAAQSQFGALGRGVKVGVLSDSYDSYDAAANGGPAKTNASDDIKNGDLPADGVQVLEEITDKTGATDEGRAMLQIVHDVAPGASLAFASASNGEASFANNIIRLQEAGSKVIVDDVSYFNEPMFQDGIIAQAVDQVVARGSVYFSSAGNTAKQSYEANFRRSGKTFMGCELHNFGNGRRVDGLQKIQIPAGRSALIFLQWDEPFASVSRGGKGSRSDLDLFILDEAGKVIPPDPDKGQFTISAQNNINGDPIEAVQYINASTEPVNVNLAITHCAGTMPRRIKYVNFRSGAPLEYDTQSSTSYGHANSRNGVGVGAADYAQTPAFGTNPPVQESFSSRGGTPILRDLNGNRTFENRQQPRLVGPDCADTSFFFALAPDPENNGFPNFCGTSAAAPHVAGVAALMLEKAPELNPLALYALMAATALDMGRPGPDVDTGFGLVQADKALELLDYRK